MTFNSNPIDKEQIILNGVKYEWNNSKRRWEKFKNINTILDYTVEKSGEGSFSTGHQTLAIGKYSFSEGGNDDAEYNKSYGISSHTEGINTQSGGKLDGYGNVIVNSGKAAHAEGIGTIALNNSSHAAGMYNIGTSTETIHETGIGTSPTNKKNAFEIYTDGRLRAPELSITKIIDNKSLITKEYLDKNISDITAMQADIDKNTNDISDLKANGSGSSDVFKVIDTLPAASLALFEKIRYCIDTNKEYLCVANSTTPASDDDCFWVER